MPLPGDLHTVTVTGTATRADGSAAAGAAVAFAMPGWLVDTTSHQAIVPKVFTARADGSGAWSVSGVIATDQGQVSPINWAYTFTVNDAGNVYSATVQVPTSPNPTTFDALVPVGVVAGAANLYVPLAQRAAPGGVATLGSDSKVPPEQLPASSGGTAVSSVTATNATIAVNNADPANPTVGLGVAQLANLAAGIQTSLGLANTSLQLAPTDPAAAAYGCHATNVDPAACRDNSTIGEQWFTRVLVRAGRQINLVKTLVRAAGTLSTTGLNGFALYSDDFATLLWNSVSDDTMWTATGEVSKAVSGAIAGLTNRTPAVDTWYHIGISAGRGYSAAPNFPFANFSGSSVLSDAGGYRCRYRAAAYAAWPASINPAVDLAGTLGFMPPIMIG